MKHALPLLLLTAGPALAHGDHSGPLLPVHLAGHAAPAIAVLVAAALLLHRVYRKDR
jgi:hypothetical protein